MLGFTCEINKYFEILLRYLNSSLTKLLNPYLLSDLDDNQFLQLLAF